MRSYYAFLLLFASITVMACTAPSDEQALAWPELSQENKPWTRWWWMGSAVDEQNLSRSLQLYSDIGLGGVEITPIYGVRGHEDAFVDYLSEGWMDRFAHTLSEAGRLDLGVDMATGTGWPFGGPHVDASDASKYVAHKTYALQGGARLQEAISYTQAEVLRTVLTNPDINDIKRPIRDNDNLQALALDQVRFAQSLPIQAVMAYGASDESLDLTDKVDAQGFLDWTAPAGEWTIYAVFQGQHGKMVERAAPGGEGYAINHFSKDALENYLVPFDEAFADRDLSALRGFFNDSYEVDDARGEADWTPAFFDEFEARRGYDLRNHLPALFGNADEARSTEDRNSRVLTDYRQTLSELLLDEFTEPWTNWAHERSAITRNQAHGSPGNLLDLYAASDIPETESTELMRIKVASSAANVTGKPLTSAEAATWLDEHFLSNWADVKQAVDWFFIGGVNHIVYHGTSYSPADASWPGWLFYAAVHFSPQHPMWEDFGALNTYVGRVQSILQAGQPANDVLLYLPVLDRFAQRDPSLLVHFHGIHPFEGMDVHADADLLQQRGYAFDFISDLQLSSVQEADQQLIAGGNRYEVVVVPGAKLMPEATLTKLLDLAAAGATVIFHNQLPEDVPGLGDLETRRASFLQKKGELQFESGGAPGLQMATLGNGRVLLGDDLQVLLSQAGVQRETMTDENLAFVRRARSSGTDYFIANRGTQAVNAWVPVQAQGQSAALFNPMAGDIGMARVRNRQEGASDVYLQLPPGESMLVRFYDEALGGPVYPYVEPTGTSVALDAPWEVQFVSGGAVLPEEAELQSLASWTVFAGEAGAAFAGTAAYTTTFPAPNVAADAYLLNLGAVHETARVTLNGVALGTRVGPDYSYVVGADVLQADNELVVEVSNGMANRIAAMDRAGTTWKKFYNINVSARLPENRNADLVFDASNWEPLAAGLLGPVTLTPSQIYQP